MPTEENLMRGLIHFAVFVVSACIAWAGFVFLMGPGVAPPFLAWPLVVLLACGAVSLVFLRKQASPANMIGMALALAAGISYLFRAVIDATGGGFAWIDFAEMVVGFSGVIIVGIGHVPPAQDTGRTDSAASESATA
jgi:hypothetical protein